MLSTVFLQLCGLGLVSCLLLGYVRDAKTNVEATVHDATRQAFAHAQRLLNATIAFIVAALVLCSPAPILDVLIPALRTPSGEPIIWIVAAASTCLLMLPTLALGWAAYPLFRTSRLSVDLSEAMSYVRKEGLVQFVEQKVLLLEDEAITALGGEPVGPLAETSRAVLQALSRRNWILSTILNHPTRIAEQLTLPDASQRRALVNELLKTGRLVRCTHRQRSFLMTPGQQEKLKQGTNAPFKALTEGDVLTEFIRWASCHAAVEAIVKSLTPVEDIKKLSIEADFQEKLRALSIGPPFTFQPDIDASLKARLPDIDKRIAVVKRASDREECLVASKLVMENIGNRFSTNGYFRRETIWKDVP